MCGVFIAEPSVAGLGRQLLNTVVEQVLKKAELSLLRNIRQLKKGSGSAWVEALLPDAGLGHLRGVSRQLGWVVIWRTM